jgi:biopolymer transport protein ExbD
LEKVFLIKNISFYLSFISLVVMVVFVVLNFITAEKVKVNLRKTSERKVLKLEDEDWTKSVLENKRLDLSNPKKEEFKQDIKNKQDTKPKSDKFELKDL